MHCGQRCHRRDAQVGAVAGHVRLQIRKAYLDRTGGPTPTSPPRALHWPGYAPRATLCGPLFFDVAAGGARPP